MGYKNSWKSCRRSPQVLSLPLKNRQFIKLISQNKKYDPSGRKPNDSSGCPGEVLILSSRK